MAHFRLRVPSGNQWVPCKHSASKEHCILEAKELPSSPSPPTPQLHIRASERDNWFLVDQAPFGTMMLRLLTRPALKLEWLDGADGCENYLEREREIAVCIFVVAFADRRMRCWESWIILSFYCCLRTLCGKAFGSALFNGIVQPNV